MDKFVFTSQLAGLAVLAYNYDDDSGNIEARVEHRLGGGIWWWHQVVAPQTSWLGGGTIAPVTAGSDGSLPAAGLGGDQAAG